MELLQLSSGYGSNDVLLSFSRTPCPVFLFQVVRFLFGALDEDIKTATMWPRHGRRRRPAEVVETTASLSSRHWTECFIKHSVSVRRNASRMCRFYGQS